MTDRSIYWYDFETFGSDPRRCRAAQFAGLRTDENLEPLGEPLELYCRPAQDFLPDVMSCLITRITPGKALEAGVGEAEFIGRIRQEFSRPGTCVAGYNNIRFDDELTRQLLYRNFFDPYEHEWRNGNSRWDIIDMARLCAATRPQGINWPKTEEGATVFRLSELSRANGLEHEHAHDALSDVRATIALARLIRDRQPRLFDYVFKLRGKDKVAAQIDLFTRKPILHVSGRYPARQGCLGLVIPVGAHPVNNNGVIVYDLRIDPRQWAELSVEQLARHLFTPRKELAGERLPLKIISRNRCPVVTSPAVLQPEQAAAFGIDQDACRGNWEYLVGNHELMARFRELFQGGEDGHQQDDPDFMIYSGGFFPDSDRSHMETLRGIAPRDLGRVNLPFRDSRLPEMLFRYRARNYPETLNETENTKWREFCRSRLEDPEALEKFSQSLEEVRASDLPGREEIISELTEYAAGIRAAVA